MAVLGSLPTYDDRGYPFEAFLYSICSRKVADAQRGILRSATPVAQVPDATDPAPGPEAVVVIREDAHRARQLLLRLPHTQKQVLVLRVEMGLTTEETAASLRMSVGAVRVAQHRALVRLREQLLTSRAERRVLILCGSGVLDRIPRARRRKGASHLS